MSLTAPDKVRQKIAHMVTGEVYGTPEELRGVFENDALYDELRDAEQELRYGTYETGLPSQSSRHYEAKEVAAVMLDGSVVGWTKWYGGGKHGEPESIDWIDDAYDVEMTEETRVVKVFKKKEPA